MKKLTSEELPDFYNITLERPKDDPDGYDVLYVEAAFMVGTSPYFEYHCMVLYSLLRTPRGSMRG